MEEILSKGKVARLKFIIIMINYNDWSVSSNAAASKVNIGPVIQGTTSSMDYRERGSHVRGVYPTQDTSRRGTARAKQGVGADTRIIVKEEEAQTRIMVKEVEADKRIIVKEEQAYTRKIVKEEEAETRIIAKEE